MFIISVHIILTGLFGSSCTHEAGGTGANRGSGAKARPANFCPSVQKIGKALYKGFL